MMGTPVQKIAVFVFFCLLPTMMRADADDNVAAGGLQATIGTSFSSDWTTTFIGMVTEGLSQSSVPPRILVTIWKSIPPDWIAEDPQAAAGQFLAAAEEADRALRRGIPSSQVRAEIRGIWRTLSGKASGPILKRQNRGEKSVQDLEKGIKRRSDSGIQSIGNAGSSGQGTGSGDEGSNSGGSGSGGRYAD